MTNILSYITLDLFGFAVVLFFFIRGLRRSLLESGMNLLLLPVALLLARFIGSPAGIAASKPTGLFPMAGACLFMLIIFLLVLAAGSVGVTMLVAFLRARRGEDDEPGTKARRSAPGGLLGLLRGILLVYLLLGIVIMQSDSTDGVLRPGGRALYFNYSRSVYATFIAKHNVVCSLEFPALMRLFDLYDRLNTPDGRVINLEKGFADFIISRSVSDAAADVLLRRRIESGDFSEILRNPNFRRLTYSPAYLGVLTSFSFSASGIESQPDGAKR